MLLTSSWTIDILIFISTVIFVAYKYMTRNFNYWKSRNVPGPKPVPFYGNFLDISTFKITASEGLKKLYDSHEGPYVGIFVFDKPVLLLKSPEIINSVLVKDSSVFMHKTITLPDHNLVIKNFLFFQNPPGWKKNRTAISPAFSPSKLKGMFPFIDDIAQETVKYTSKHIGVIDTKELFNKTVVEAIVQCFFGVKANVFNNEDSEFLHVYHKMFNFTWRNAVVQASHFFLGRLVNLFKLNFLQPSILDYLTSVLTNVLKNRKPHDGKARDMIDVIKEMESNGDQFKDYEIMGSIISFFVAGGETMSQTLFYLFYEMAVNHEIQDKLRAEITNNIEEFRGINFEAIQKTPYMEACILETLRKYAVVPHFCRKAVEQDFQFPGTDLVVEKGTYMYIPLYAMHMDDKYWPEPKKFDPDRHVDFDWNQNGRTIFMPFGAGPRRCIGERFAVVTMKTTLMYMLTNFKIDKCDETPDEIVFEPKSFILQPKSGNCLKITPLNNKI